MFAREKPVCANPRTDAKPVPSGGLYKESKDFQYESGHTSRSLYGNVAKSVSSPCFSLMYAVAGLGFVRNYYLYALYLKHMIKPPEDFCTQILELNKNIRFAGVVDKFGKMAMSEYRKGLVPLLSREQAMSSILQASIRMGSRKVMQSSLGKIIYSMTLYEKVVMVSIPLGDHSLLMISFETKGDHESILMKEILPFLGKHGLR